MYPMTHTEFTNYTRVTLTIQSLLEDGADWAEIDEELRDKFVLDLDSKSIYESERAKLILKAIGMEQVTIDCTDE